MNDARSSTVGDTPVNQIVCGDNVAVMGNWPSACVDLTVTSPQYDLTYSVVWWYDSTMKITNCKVCGKQIVRPSKPGVFCGLECKGKAQRQKVVSKEWLHQKYVVEGLGTYEIAKLVGRDPKRVYEWLQQDGIPMRTRHDSVVAMNKRSDTIEKRRVSTANRIVTEAQKRKLSASRTGKHYPKLQGDGNGMFGKCREQSPTWKGGLTPERQALYSSLEWSNVVVAVWRRDAATCQKCGCLKTKDKTFDIHHIVEFAFEPLRAEVSNLVLLCRECHKFVHSRKNVSREFLRDKPE
jgi:hypothetical protein